MEIVFLPRANDDLYFWKKSDNSIIQKKTHSLLVAIKILHLKALENPR